MKLIFIFLLSAATAVAVVVYALLASSLGGGQAIGLNPQPLGEWLRIAFAHAGLIMVGVGAVVLVVFGRG